MVNYAIVTGASKGIGKAIAEELASRGMNIILVARSEKLLQENAKAIAEKYKVKTDVFVADLLDRKASFDLLDWVEEKKYHVNILVNNAGFGLWEKFDKGDLQFQENITELNVQALVRLCHLFIPMLREQAKGATKSHILNVSSLGAYQPLPNMAIYGAGKAFVLSFSLAIRDELRNDGINVSCLCPGGVWTEFTETAGSADVAEKMKNVHITAEKAAKITVKAMLRKKAQIIPGGLNKISRLLVKIAPTSWSVASARKIFRKD